MKRRNNKAMAYIRILACFYLLYISYKLIKAVTGGEPGTSPVMLVAAVLFIVISLGLLWFSWKELKQIEAAEKEEAKRLAREHEEDMATPVITPDEPTEPKSLSERAHLAKELGVAEEENEEEEEAADKEEA